LKPLPLLIEVESKVVLRKVSLAHKALAELKGVIATIPNQNILNETLILREAKESSAIENIISTFDEVYQSNILNKHFASSEAKEVHLYAEALKEGLELINKNGLLTSNHILQIQGILIKNRAGFRKLPGTKLLNEKSNEVVYTPPQDYHTIVSLIRNLEEFINNDEMMDVDPLVKMAIIHHQLESIHPFYDGNGRTGRIINILYLILKKLLDLPVLYLSRFIIQNKATYYSLLQKVRVEDTWEEWVLFMLEGVEQTANSSILLIKNIKELMESYKEEIRSTNPKIYSQDLLDNLFKYPYTKIEYLQEDLRKSRNTCISYLEYLVKEGFLVKQKKGRDNFYINQPLFDLLSDKTPVYKTMKQKNEDVQAILCDAIRERRLVKFYYESDSSGKKEWRTVEPYIIGIKHTGNVFLAGLPVIEKSKPIEKRVTGHYSLKKINLNNLEILSEKYTEPKVERKRITDTPTIKVICRFIYDDENTQKNYITMARK
jgi:Fic family protein